MSTALSLALFLTTIVYVLRVFKRTSIIVYIFYTVLSVFGILLSFFANENEKLYLIGFNILSLALITAELIYHLVMYRIYLLDNFYDILVKLYSIDRGPVNTDQFYDRTMYGDKIPFITKGNLKFCRKHHIFDDVLRYKDGKIT